MANIELSDKGVEILLSLSSKIVDSLEAAADAAEQLQSHMQSIDDIGPHRDSIIRLAVQIKTLSENAANPVAEVSNDLRQLAEKYRDMIANNPFGDDGSGGSGDSLSGADNSSGNNKAECMVIRSNIPADSDYTGILSRRYDNANPNVKALFDKFADNLEICDADYPPTSTPHYSPCDFGQESRGVYYNAAADKDNPRGAGSTYFHELGHMIDHAAGGFEYSISNDPRFTKALLEDGKEILKYYDSLTYGKKEAFVERLYSDMAHSFSDLIDAITDGKIHGKYGHERSYWQRENTLSAEAFAHFFEASMGGGAKLKLLSAFFPSAFGVFDSLIDSHLSNSLS